ncbi:arylsulfatase [Comamonas thiooxydans]|uniref:arylsulfatase n=2 Tax=Comamonas thiooxydans TaxID=363952 RepID=UPI000B410954|nr:arylsulfatase [Comamonas thiooxydans]BDB71479.1 arylsulfatase [Comamonas thiooxydans]
MPAQYALRKVAYATAVLSACAWLNGCGTGNSMPEQTASAPVAKATSTQNKPPNVIVILADDMGFNDIEPFGQDAISTPNLNAMAQEGMRFTNFHVHATCSPTRAQLLTGVDNHLAGMGSMGEYRTPEMDKYPGNYIGSLNNRVKTIAEMLQEQGYSTFMAGKWHLGGKPEQLPKARGFQRSYVLVGPGGSHWDDNGLLGVNPKLVFTEDDKPIARDTGEFSSNIYTDRFLGYLSEAQRNDKPFFGYLAFQAVHDPLHAPEDFIKKYRGKFSGGYDEAREKIFARMKKMGVIPAGTKMHATAPLFKPWAQLDPAERKRQERLMEVYAAMLDNMDWNIGRVVDSLKRSGAYDNTVIFFFSDNGPSAAYMDLYPGNADGKWIEKTFDTTSTKVGQPLSFAGVGPGWASASAAPFKLFKMVVTEGGTISPMIVRGPTVSSGGKINDGFLGVEDILPTIADLTRTQRGNDRNGVPLEPLKGYSFAPVLQGASQRARKPDFERGEELFGNKAYRQGRWKISWLPKPYGEERWQLFDTDADRGETQDLAQQYPQRVADMAARYDQWAKDNRVMTWDYKYLNEQLFGYFDWRQRIPRQILNPGQD